MLAQSRHSFLLLLLLLLPLSAASMTFVHDHTIYSAMSLSSSSPALPDTFQSFGSFSFIETREEPAVSKTTKPIPKKLKCACEFQKVDSESNAAAAAASFLERVVVPAKTTLLRSQH